MSRPAHYTTSTSESSENGMSAFWDELIRQRNIALQYGRLNLLVRLDSKQFAGVDILTRSTST